MSGHSKWANIKRKKEANDKVKGSSFGKLARTITMAVIQGGRVGDPNHNVRLRLAVDLARSSNLPKDNIERAIEKGMGKDGLSLQEVVFDVFGKDGVFYIVVASTDNPTRTHAELRTLIERHGGKMGSQGSVMHYFKRCGVVIYEKLEGTMDRVFPIAEILSAFDIQEFKDEIDIFIPFEKLGYAMSHTQEGTVKAISVKEAYIPLSSISLDESAVIFHNRFTEMLLQNEDVHAVFSNVLEQDKL